MNATSVSERAPFNPIPNPSVVIAGLIGYIMIERVSGAL